MKAVVQRVKEAKVEVAGETVGAIERGLLVLLGVGDGDGPEDSAWMINKISNLRIFPNDGGKMSKSVRDIGGSVLMVSQFTLYGDVKKGNRPSFSRARTPDEATKIFDDLCASMRTAVPVETGRFGAMMDVFLVNDGPVTIMLDSQASG